MCQLCYVLNIFITIVAFFPDNPEYNLPWIIKTNIKKNLNILKKFT